MSAKFLTVVFAILVAWGAGPAFSAPKYARSALYYDGFSKVIKKGVTKVKNPATGVFCIKRKWSAGFAYEHVALVTAEVDTSGGPDLLAHWAYGAGNCADSNEWFEVRTYRMVGGSWTPANDVSFSFVVP